MRKFIKIAVATLMSVALTGCGVEYAENMTQSESGEVVYDAESSFVTFRYSDASMTAYFEQCEEMFEKSNPGVSVTLQLVSDNGFIDGVNNDSLSAYNVPDVYLAHNSDVGTYYLAGLAAKNTSDYFTTENYCMAALNACSYKDNLVAYPLSYETSFLLYNKIFVTESGVATFEQIKEFSNNADFTSEEAASIQAIFRCDLQSIFTNYGFISSAIKLGGKTGDDSSVVSICNDKTLELTEQYLALQNYFSLKMSYSYKTIFKKFLEGSYVAAVGTTDSLASLAEAELDYGIAAMPDYSDSLEINPLSITTAVIVNPYSKNVKLAEKFAAFVTYECANNLYEKAGVLSARKDIQYERTEFANIYKSYEKSVPKNKLLYGEQLYPRLEIAMHNIVAGSDAKEELSQIDEYMKSQLK